MNTRITRAIAVTMLVAASAGAGTAQGAAGRLQGTYKLHGAGRVAPEDFDGTVADGAWTVATALSAKNDQGMLPAKLISASHGPFVQSCGEDPSHGTITTQMSGVTDPAALFSFFLRLDLLHNRGSVDAYADPYDLGTSRVTTQTRCDADYGGSSDAEDVFPVSAAFSAISRPNSWKARRTATNRWVASGTQQLHVARSPGDSGPSTATLDLTMTGSPSALQAGCRLPTPHDLRKARTRAAALRILHRAGLRADNSLTRLPVRYVPKGHFFVNDWAVDHYGICGGTAQLVLSTGAPSGAGGHGGA